MWDHVLTVDLSSQFTLTREIGRTMIERGYGKIVFTASLLSFQGGHQRARLRCCEVRRSRAHQGAGQRVDVQGRHRQRHRAGLHRHRQHPGAAGRPRPQPLHRRAHPGRPLGQGAATSAAPRSSSPRPRPTTSAASSCRSTAAGWADEPGDRPVLRHRARSACCPSWSSTTPSTPSRWAAALKAGGLPVAEVTFRTAAAAGVAAPHGRRPRAVRRRRARSCAPSRSTARSRPGPGSSSLPG